MVILVAAGGEGDAGGEVQQSGGIALARGVGLVVDSLFDLADASGFDGDEDVVDADRVVGAAAELDGGVAGDLGGWVDGEGGRLDEHESEGLGGCP